MHARDIFPIDDIDAVVEPYDWDQPRQHEAEIEAYWRKATAQASAIFNGTVMIQHRAHLQGGVFKAWYAPTSYKNFLGYLRLPIPEVNVRNGFSMAALRSRDGAFLLGKMNANTANGGKVYFPAGTPDLDDVKDGRVDLAGSVMREMGEETGLRPEEVTVGAGWTCMLIEKRAGFMRDVLIDLPAEEARRLMLERMRAMHEQELTDIVIVRRDDPMDNPMMPTFMADFMRYAFARM